MDTLKKLFESIKNGETELNDELPVFSKSEPDSTWGVWSYDDTHMIVGTCTDDIEIVER
jgi:hypothetical protein